jgi:riboflavin kinase/FMN adenylyltransferase
MIQEGEMERVKKFLGRSHMIEGKVIKGHGRGKDIGFPTINIETDFELIPKNGVYVTEVEIDGKRFPSVTNMGYNPTFNDRDLSIETYILNFSENLYGREITLCFHKRIRDEMKFNSVDELKQRIGMDVEAARVFFNSDTKL